MEWQWGQGRNQREGYWGGRTRGRSGKEEVTKDLICQVRHLVVRVAAGLPKEPSWPLQQSLGLPKATRQARLSGCQRLTHGNHTRKGQPHSSKYQWVNSK